MQNSAYPSSEVRAMRRFVLFVLAFSAVVTVGALLPYSRFNSHDAVDAAASQGNWTTGVCQDNGGHWAHWGETHICQLRQTTVTLPSGHLSVDSTNGAITVLGEDRPDVALEASVNVWAPSTSDARDLLSYIVIETANGNIHAQGPHTSFFTRGGYAVSYRLSVPHHLAAEFHTTNGGISLSHLDGAIRFATTNGSITLDQLSGKVEGDAVNGALNIALDGDRWHGAGLDASTVNGGITLHLPDNYSAHLEASTVNGGISVNFPITVQGAIKNHLDTNIGGGGPTIQTGTVNGGITISHDADSGSAD